MDSISLSNNKTIPQIMLGSFQMDNQEDMDAVVEAALSQGIYGFDTSPSYRTEEILAKAIHKYQEKHPELKREQLFLDSKIDSWQMIARNGDIRPFVEDILQKTGFEYWDLLLIHWPQPEHFVATYKCMEKLYEEGLVKAIGICNCQKRHFEKLKKEGCHVVPHVAQNEVHPINTENNLVEYCKEEGIILQAYSPLCRMIPNVKDNALLNILADRYGVSVAQIMLRWHTQRGLVPVVKTSSPKRVKENTDIFGFALSDEDMQAITSMDQHFKMFLESRCCPGF